MSSITGNRNGIICDAKTVVHGGSAVNAMSISFGARRYYGASVIIVIPYDTHILGLLRSN